MINIIEPFDFTPIGLAIKQAREEKGITREVLAEKLDIAARHLQSIELEGQYPSFQLFYQLVAYFDISLDQYTFPDKTIEKTSLHRKIDTLLNSFDDTDLTIIEGTAKGICKAKRQTEE